MAERDRNRILANVTHEMRTPLNAIIGFSEILTSELQAPKRGRSRVELVQYAELIHESGQHLLQVVNGLLDLSRIQAGERALALEVLDLGELLRQTARLMDPIAADAGVRIELDLPARRDPVRAERRALRQIALNLLSNAIKFSELGSTVFLSGDAGPERATICVRDRGIGIAEEHLARLGEPFFQAGGLSGAAQEGTGLGLAIVKALAELHHGRMEVESAPGVGTSVRIVLPALGEQGEERSGAS